MSLWWSRGHRGLGFTVQGRFGVQGLGLQGLGLGHEPLRRPLGSL